MAAVYRAAGVQFSVSDLNHSVLHLEQMLTTGGGWQDQVGDSPSLSVPKLRFCFQAVPTAHGATRDLRSEDWLAESN